MASTGPYSDAAIACECNIGQSETSPARHTPASRQEAFALLAAVGAPPRLIRHAELVGEAADALLEGFAQQRIPIDAAFVRVGVVIHDVGKTLVPAELDEPGSAHEPAGERLLLDHGASPGIARVARTHAAWRDTGVDLEDLVVALADKLWKGARVDTLETLVVDRAAERLQCDRWKLFTELDSIFENIASRSDERLARSAV